MTSGNAPDTSYSYDAAGRLSGQFIDHQAIDSYDTNDTFGYTTTGQIASELRDNDTLAFDNHTAGTTAYTA